jgi:hypothetical protein
MHATDPALSLTLLSQQRGVSSLSLLFILWFKVRFLLFGTDLWFDQDSSVLKNIVLAKNLIGLILKSVLVFSEKLLLKVENVLI